MAKEMFQESKENIVYIDGEFIRRSEAKVSVFDHSFLYGDGVFERLRIYKGRILRLDDHVERTFDSAKAIGLNMPLTKPDLKRALVEAVNKNGITEAGYMRLVVSRGEGPLGMDPRAFGRHCHCCIIRNLSRNVDY